MDEQPIEWTLYFVFQFDKVKFFLEKQLEGDFDKEFDAAIDRD